MNIPVHEVEQEMENRAYEEIRTHHANLMTWLTEERPTATAEICAKLMKGHSGQLEAQLLLSLLRNDYVSYRKYQCDMQEFDEVALNMELAERDEYVEAADD